MFEILNKPHADPVELPLTGSLWPISTILVSYLLFVLKVGRQFMSNRQPYDLKSVLKVYNITQVIFNTTVFLLATYFIFWRKVYDLNCLTVMPLDHPLKSKERVLSYLYYLNKVFDLLDTIFIVLRKSYRQISVLHLVHHVSMATGGYFSIRFNGHGGHLLIMGYVNLFVHAVMYGYYYLASQYPHIKESLWWKKYITIIQMVQFLVIFLHNLWTIMQPDCKVPRFLLSLVFVMSIVMFVMFSNFYIKAYIRPKKTAIKKKEK